MEVIPITRPTKQHADQMISSIHEWIMMYYPRWNHSQMRTLLHASFKKDLHWQEGLYGVELGEPGQWLFRIRQHRSKIMASGKLFYWLQHLSLFKALEIKHALHPLWLNVPPNHGLLEWIYPAHQQHKAKKYYCTLMDLALSQSKAMKLHTLDYPITRSNLYGASICRRLGFDLMSYQSGQWYIMSKRL